MVQLGSWKAHVQRDLEIAGREDGCDMVEEQVSEADVDLAAVATSHFCPFSPWARVLSPVPLDSPLCDVFILRNQHKFKLTLF